MHLTKRVPRAASVVVPRFRSHFGWYRWQTAATTAGVCVILRVGTMFLVLEQALVVCRAMRSTYGILRWASLDRWRETSQTSRCCCRCRPATTPERRCRWTETVQFLSGELEKDFKGKRIAWAGDFGGFAPHEPGVLEVCETALKTFESIGCSVEEAHPDYPLDAVWRAFMRLRFWQAGGALLAFYNDSSKRAFLKPEAIFEIENGLKQSAFDITAASVVRSEWYHAVGRFFERYDFFLVPTAQLFPFDVDARGPQEIAGKKMETYHEWMKAVCLVTMSDCPALAVPAGFGSQGSPIGLQIIGPNHRELACLQLALAYEIATGWTNKRAVKVMRIATGPPPAGSFICAMSRSVTR